MPLANRLVTKQEAEILLHHHKVELARWSDEEPDAKQLAQEGVDYWQSVVDGPFKVTEFDRHFPDVSGPAPA